MAILTLTSVPILDFDYACIAIFMLACLFYAATAFYYAITGREKISGVAKCGFLVFGILTIACLFDGGANPYFYVRPSDGVKVYWFRQIVSTFIMPLLLLGFFELLHNPHEKHGIKEKNKGGNMEYVYCLTRWSVFGFSFIAEAFNLPAILSDDYFMRWTSYAFGAFCGLIAFFPVYFYLRTYGIHVHHHKKGHIIRYMFYDSRAKAILAFIAWVLIIAYWITREFLLAFGHGLGLYLSYDNEVAGYMSIQLVLLFAVWFACWAAKKAHQIITITAIYDVPMN
jgi:hypothetical protein